MAVEQLEIVAVVAVLLIVAASYLAPKFGIATPIALVVMGLGMRLLLGELQETAVAQVLDNPDLRRRDGEPFDPAVLEKVRRHWAQRAEHTAAREQDPVAAQLPELDQRLQEVQQDALNEARSLGAYDSRTIARVQMMLDVGATRDRGS